MFAPSPMVSLVTTLVSLEEVCLPSFEVWNCWLTLVASCLDDENDISLTVIASFPASRFALPSIPLIVLHSLVTSVLWSMVSTSLSIFSVCAHRCGGVSFTEVISSVHHVQYLCWYSFLMESVAYSRVWCDAAMSRTVRKIFLSLWQSVVRERLLRAASTSRLYLSQLAFLG